MQMEVRHPSSTSTNHSSKLKMPRPSRYYESYTTSGPNRSVELQSYKTHTVNPPTAIAPTRRQTHSRATRTKKEARSKPRSATTEEVQSKVCQDENRPKSFRARPLPDGGFPFQSHHLCIVSNPLTGSWEYFYPDVDSATPSTKSKPKKDISDPHIYIGEADPVDVDYYHSLQAEFTPVVEEETVESDDSAEYQTQAGFIDPSVTSQPPVTLIPPAVDWDSSEGQAHHLETSSHPSHASDDFGQTYDTFPNPKYPTTTRRRKRRESLPAPVVPKPSFLESFLFPGAYREARKQGKVRNDRVEMWTHAVAKAFAEGLVQAAAQQAQQYSDNGVVYQGGAAPGHGYLHDVGEYQTPVAAAYGYSRRGLH
ncbi:hypothetical protein V8F20_006294 [Naviculisporaceae sp. PSN 640]